MGIFTQLAKKKLKKEIKPKIKKAAKRVITDIKPFKHFLMHFFK